MLLRPGVVGDIDRLAALHVSVWRDTYRELAPKAAFDALNERHRREHWQQMLSRGSESFTVVAEVDERLVGFGHASPATHAAMGNVGEIVHLYVDRDSQGGGIGLAMFRSLFDFLREQGHPVVRLGVVDGNTNAISFYERQGGQRTGTYVDGVLWRSTNLIYEWST